MSLKTCAREGCVKTFSDVRRDYTQPRSYCSPECRAAVGRAKQKAKKEKKMAKEFDDTEEEAAASSKRRRQPYINPRGEATRERLRELLASGPKGTAEMSAALGLGASGLLRHLNAMPDVSRIGEGKHTRWQLADEAPKPEKPRKTKPAPERKRAPYATSTEPEPTEEAPAVEQIELTPDEVRALVLLSRTSLERLSRLL